MNDKDYSGYHIASISEADNTMIDRLEKEIKEKTQKDVILVAYQSDKAK